MEKNFVTSSSSSLNTLGIFETRRPKFPSLDDLKTAHFDVDDSFLTINDDGTYRTPLVWKAFCKLARAAWMKAKVDSREWTVKGDEAELRERSALIQLSSVSALVAKDREILEGQTRELAAMNKSVAATQIEANCREERNGALKIREKSLAGEISSARLRLAEQFQCKTDVKTLVEMCEDTLRDELTKVDALKSEVDLKRTEIEDASAQRDDLRVKVRNSKAELDMANWRQSDLTENLRRSNAHLERLTRVLLEKTDRNELLKEHLRETKTVNAEIGAELAALQFKFREQETTMAELEKALKGQKEELEVLRGVESRHEERRMEKVMFGVWAATCAMHLIKSFSLRWP